MADVRIGVSGWTYAGWRNSFYPEKLVQKKELHYMSRSLNSIEINGTFYALQKPATYQSWFAETPDTFRFAVKAPKYITHIRRLKDVAKPLNNFLASGLLALGDKLGPILWQFPPNVMLKDDRFERFLGMLPRTTHLAAELAKNHDDKVQGRSFTTVAPIPRAVRHAFEFRHPSFLNPDFLAMLRAHDVAFVIADSGLKSPYTEELTAGFVYIRLHGQEEKYQSGYTPAAIRKWAGKIAAWSAAGLDVFCYFDNDAKEAAPFNAVELIARLGLAPRDEKAVATG